VIVSRAWSDTVRLGISLPVSLACAWSRWPRLNELRNHHRPRHSPHRATARRAGCAGAMSTCCSSALPWPWCSVPRCTLRSSEAASCGATTASSCAPGTAINNLRNLCNLWWSFSMLREGIYHRLRRFRRLVDRLRRVVFGQVSAGHTCGTPTADRTAPGRLQPIHLLGVADAAFQANQTLTSGAGR